MLAFREMSVTSTFFPLVAVLEEETHQPLVFVNVTLVRELQLWNALAPILSTLLPIVTLVSELQFWNAELPIVVTLLPIVTLVSELQFWNAELSIVVTLSGILIFVRLLQPEKAKEHITFVLLLIVQFVIDVSFGFINTTYGLPAFPR